jgi:hypothetical protein
MWRGIFIYILELCYQKNIGTQNKKKITEEWRKLRYVEFVTYIGYNEWRRREEMSGTSNSVRRA